MLDTLSSARAGLQDAAWRGAVSAHNLANLATEDFRPLRLDGSQGPAGSLDETSEMVDNMLALRAYQISGKTLQAADEILASLINLRA